MKSFKQYISEDQQLDEGIKDKLMSALLKIQPVVRLLGDARLASTAVAIQLLAMPIAKKILDRANYDSIAKVVDLVDFLRDNVATLISQKDHSIDEVYKDSGLGDWFHSQSAGGEPGWDRYNSKGEKAGKCGDSKEGDPYAACLSKQKADKLGKDGIASFVRRKREAQKSAGDSKKGGEEKKSQKPTSVATKASESALREGKPKDMGQFVKNMKKKLKDSGVDMSKEVSRDRVQGIIGSTATSRLAARGIIDLKGGEKRESTINEKDNKPTDPAKWEKALDKARNKFDVFPSAYASAYASKEYKKMGGGWKSTK